MGNAEDTPRTREKREASIKQKWKQWDWKGWMKQEGSQLESTWVRWWIVLMLLGAVDLVSGIVRSLEFPWGWREYILVSFLTALIALTEWLFMLAFRFSKWMWKNKKVSS